MPIPLHPAERARLERIAADHAWLRRWLLVVSITLLLLFLAIIVGELAH